MQLELQNFNRVHLKPGRKVARNPYFLFPVGPDAPLEQRPYMQRPGGRPDGQDLKQKCLKGVGQGQEVKLTEVDKKYSSLGTSFKDFLAIQILSQMNIHLKVLVQIVRSSKWSYSACG